MLPTHKAINMHIKYRSPELYLNLHHCQVSVESSIRRHIRKTSIYRKRSPENCHLGRCPTILQNAGKICSHAEMLISQLFTDAFKTFAIYVLSTSLLHKPLPVLQKAGIIDLVTCVTWCVVNSGTVLSDKCAHTFNGIILSSTFRLNYERHAFFTFTPTHSCYTDAKLRIKRFECSLESFITSSFLPLKISREIQSSHKFFTDVINDANFVFIATVVFPTLYNKASFAAQFLILFLF